MKRFLLFLTAAMLVASLGCDQAKNPTAPEKAITEKDETELTDAAAKASGAVIRVPGDYATIQAAVDAASPGDKIVVKAKSDPYNENVFVNKAGIQIVGKGSVTLNGSFLVRANDVEIYHFNINVLTPPGGPDGGIDISAVSGVKIRHNTITGNNRGIFLNGSTGCLVEKNTCAGLAADGIVLYYYANNNTIARNTSTGNAHGIILIFSDNNVVSGNECSANNSFGNSTGIHVSGSGNKIQYNVCNRNGSTGIVVTSGSKNIFGPGNTANFNQLYGITLFSDASNNIVKKNDFHCNSIRDIEDFGTGNTFIKNSTGPLAECQ